jgi:hypothetical protein
MTCRLAEGRPLGFNMQKLVVNNYALGILALKVTTSPQGSHFDVGINMGRRDLMKQR